MIRVENLTKYYGEFCAVDKLNLHIDKGEILGLLGPNGAGKTTTLRMLTGFFLPTSGDISVKDFSIRQNPLDIKQMIGYLPESAPLYHGMLVYDYLDYVANIRSIKNVEKIARLKKLASLCGLEGIMHKPISELSKGLKQRVGLAHAMMNDPEILVLDEPTSGLDPNQIVEIREIIRQIGSEKTVILSTHILSEAEATCDRIVIINQGKIVADGSTETLKQKDSMEYVINISLIDADEKTVRNTFETVEGVSDVKVAEEATPEILSFKVRCRGQDDIRGAVYQKIKETDWILVDFHLEEKSLEKIFRELTKEN